MKKILFILILALTFVSSASAGDLDAVKSAGVLTFGVSSDKAPFVFYDKNDDLTGIDVGLMEEAASRIGLKLDVVALSSGDLAESLTIGQVDVIGGAFSRTDARQSVMDFTSTYYIADGIFAAKSSLDLKTPLEASSFSGKKIGVLKDSGFEDWLKTELYDKGFILKKDIYTYDKTDDMIRALDKDKVDMILMDYSLFESQLMGTPGIVSFEYKTAQDKYAFGVRKGSDLKAALNSAFSEMMKDGSAQQIADKFFNMEAEEEPALIQWNKAKTPTPIPTTAVTPLVNPLVSAVTPTPIPAQTNCTHAMAYVADVTVPDGQSFSPGSAFTKTWRIRNTGNCAWGTNFVWAFASGSQMSGANRYLPKVVNPGDTVDISVDLIAPTSGGTYQGNWQLKTPDGYNIGPSIWVQIVVPGGYSAPTSYSAPTESSAKPTATPYFDFGTAIDYKKTVLPMVQPTSTPRPPFDISQIATVAEYNAQRSTPDFSVLDDINPYDYLLYH